MIIAGIVIIVVALLIGAAGVLGGNDGTQLNLGVGHVSMSASAVFLLGALALLLLVAGLGVIRSGFRRSRQHHQDRRRVDKLSRELDQAKRKVGMDEPKANEQDDRPTPI